MAIGMAAMSAAVTSSAVGFTHDMPEATNEKPLDTPYSELAETFGNPFGKIQTGCYWYWIFGNISCDGVVKDLESMKRVGIDRPYIGDVGGSGLVLPQGPVRTFSSEWKKTMQTAFATAARLDMDLGVFNCPGWSMSGGPWVKSEQAMRRFVASTLVVEGPRFNKLRPECIGSSV